MTSSHLVVLLVVAVGCGSGGNGGTGGGSATGGGTASSGGGTASNGGGTASNGGGTASNGGGTVSNGGGTASNGGGTASSGGGTASNGGGTGSTKIGSIVLSETPTSGITPSSVSATFTSQAPAGCTQSTIGSCAVTECDTAVVIDAGPATLDTAGTITIIGGSVDGGITLTYSSASSSYTPFSSTSAIWTPGDTFTVSAAGATVPAFSGKTVVAPADIMVTAPVLTSGTFASASQSAPLSIAWTGSGSAIASVVSGSATHTVVLSCTFTASPGTITADAMAKLMVSGNSVANRLVIDSAATTSFNAGDYAVALTAEWLAASGTLPITQ